jgi:hypothetical protein
MRVVLSSGIGRNMIGTSYKGVWCGNIIKMSVMEEFNASGEKRGKNVGNGSDTKWGE